MTWHNLTYKAHGRHILTNVSGQARSGELAAIVGHADSGKTVLLKILAGRVKVSKNLLLEGTIRVNGQLRDVSWRRKVAFVDQYCNAYQNLTIDEIIQFHADLKMEKLFTYAEKRAIIDYLVERLDLNEIRYRRIGGLVNSKSIGRDVLKRISIACFILEIPHVAILDEPTTDMDSTQALSLVKFLQEFCRQAGITILMTVRQPRKEIWSMLDRIFILGFTHVLCNGDPIACQKHFADNFNIDFPDMLNPLDLILDFIKGNNTAEEQNALFNAWNENSAVTFQPHPDLESQNAIKNEWVNTYWKEFCLLYSRFVRVHFRERLIIAGEILQTITLSLLIAFSYFQLGSSAKDVTNTISLFYFITACVFASVGLPMSVDFKVDRIHLVRERASGSYRMSAAYLSKLFSVLPFATALMLLFSIPIYFISGLSMPFTKFLTYLAILFALRLFGLAIKMSISACFESTYSVAIFLPFLVIFFILFGDLKAETDQITWILAWIKFLSPLYYSVQALMQNEFQGNSYQSDLDENQTVDYTYYLDKYNFQQIGIWYCFIALIGFALLYFIIGYVVLRKRTRTKQILI